MNSRTQLGIVVFFAGLIFFTRLGGAHLWDRDEPRNAGCAVEMLERNDWVTPMFNDELRSHKPVLLYWLMMSAYSLFGVSEFSARFWSAGLAVGTVVCTYVIGSRLFHPRAGAWAGVVLSSCLMFGVAARAATPDSVLVFFTTAATAAFVVLCSERSPDGSTRLRSSISLRSGVVIYGLMGFAVLAKGPVGLVLPTAVIGMFLLIERLPQATPTASGWYDSLVSVLRSFHPLHFLKTCWAMKPLLALGMVLLIAAPWYAWVGIRTEGDWLRGFFLEHNLGRAMQPMEGHGGGFWFYPVALLFGTFPWSIFAVAIIVDTTRRMRARGEHFQGYLLGSCWVLVYLILFSLARTKLPSYITPCYPGFALLTGAFIDNWSRRTHLVSNLWPRLSMATLGVVGLGLCIGLPLAAQRYLPGDEWLGALGMIPVLAAVAGYIMMSHKREHFAAPIIAVAAGLFCLGLFAVGAVQADRHQRSSEILTQIRTESPSAKIGAFGVLEPSWVFYHRDPIFGLTTDSGEILKESQRERPWHPRPLEDVRGFLASGPNQFVITTDRHLPSIEGTLPEGVKVLHELPYFLKKDRLVVLGWDQDEMVVAKENPNRVVR